MQDCVVVRVVLDSGDVSRHLAQVFPASARPSPGTTRRTASAARVRQPDDGTNDAYQSVHALARPFFLPNIASVLGSAASRTSAGAGSAARPSGAGFRLQDRLDLCCPRLPACERLAGSSTELASKRPLRLPWKSPSATACQTAACFRWCGCFRASGAICTASAGLRPRMGYTGIVRQGLQNAGNVGGHSSLDDM